MTTATTNLVSPYLFNATSNWLHSEFLPDARTEALDQRITNYVGLVGYCVLLWDHGCTFPEEVEFIWSKPKNHLTYLFLFVRYFTLLGFMGNLIAYFSQWSPEHCSQFVRYEGSCTILAIEVTALIMLSRVRAMFSTQPIIVYFVASILIAETGVNAWLMTHGEPVRHTSSIHACTMIFDPDLNFFPSLSAWFPLLYDTVVIALTVWRCLGPVRHRAAGTILRTLLKDGMLFYAVIFSINFVLAIMIASPSVRPGLKNITAQLEQLITVAMIGRITINLKREAHKTPPISLPTGIGLTDWPVITTAHDGIHFRPAISELRWARLSITSEETSEGTMDAIHHTLTLPPTAKIHEV